MHARLRFVGLLIVSLLVLRLLVQVTPSAWTRLDVTEAGTGRKIVAAVLRDGEQVVLTWKNSLFGLEVTEEFVARGGMLVLTGVTFADPRGQAPVAVAPKDVDDLYHTGGPFSARGLALPFERIVYRVGEIGDPKLRVRERLIAFKDEVGFGGVVVLTATTSSLLDRILQVFAGGDRFARTLPIVPLAPGKRRALDQNVLCQAQTPFPRVSISDTCRGPTP